MSDAILTVTLNPAVDVSTVTQTVTTEHKLRCAEVRRDPGGGGINVARVLTRFGARCHAVYPVGPVLGRLLRQLVDAEGVASLAYPVRGETRESFTVIERATGREYRFVLPGPELDAGEWQHGLDLVKDFDGPLGWVVASGSLPAGAPEDFYARLARVVRARGARLALDTSGAPLAAALDEGVHLVKPNLRELREYTGRPLETEDEWAEAALGLVDAGKAEVVALSLGHRGALLAARGAVLRAAALEVTIASTVGAGDSFVASIVWSLSRGASLEQALRTGVAGGTAALLAPGTRLAFPEDTERLAPQVEVRARDAR